MRKSVVSSPKAGRYSFFSPIVTFRGLSGGGYNHLTSSWVLHLWGYFMSLGTWWNLRSCPFKNKQTNNIYTFTEISAFNFKKFISLGWSFGAHGFQVKNTRVSVKELLWYSPEDQRQCLISCRCSISHSLLKKQKSKWHHSYHSGSWTLASEWYRI